MRNDVDQVDKTRHKHITRVQNVKSSNHGRKSKSNNHKNVDLDPGWIPEKEIISN